MFEGTPEQFWGSLKRLRELPDETEVFWYVRGKGWLFSALWILLLT